ncbi:hypothetical protein MCUN1_001651 [Malassezia cuniculi]|uniref:ABC transporter domain-containing protein n=1 Tax=Malassezia cuniculi TaxID=948313 RepID=A0AAF0EY28_9BASI|nr:hypothetical protein MCUN1_001651 [Malassezia cuniculi]
MSHADVPVDSFDPEGVDALSAKYVAAAQNEKEVADPEKGADYTYDPFATSGKFDFAAFMQKMIDENQSRSQAPREMGLVFRDLNVTGYGTGAKFHKSFGSLFLEPFRKLANIQSVVHRPVKHILHDVTGCVKPGEMLLVLGRPGAGCTTLLKSLASYRDGFRSIEGTVLYGGLDHKAIDGQLRGDVIYAPEDDNHFATLTVSQTLGFAAAARAPNSGHRVTVTDNNSRRSYINQMREVIATVLGLRHTYNTVVGNDMIRGVSGGERKRVSIGETLASRARIALFDNSSRGLDSSTALEFVRALRIATDIGRTTTLASIYQAGEALAQTFDKVIVLNRGYLVYFGPLSEAPEYFKSIGFIPQDRQTTADFLVACTDINGQRIRPGYEGKAPRHAEEQARAFAESAAGQACRDEADAYIAELQQRVTKEARTEFISDARSERTKYVPRRSKYLISWPMQVRLAIKRRAQITYGAIMIQVIMICASTFQALINGSVYYQMGPDTSALFSRAGILFFILLYTSLSAMTEVANRYEDRPVLIRQQRFAMMPPSADAIASSLLDLPIRFIINFVFVVIIYFMARLDYDAGKFFINLFATSLTVNTMVAFFRMLASLTRALPLATMISGIAILDSILYAGYAIPRPSMVVWWKWLSYCNPVSFGYEILIANEYRGQMMQCANMVPTGPGYENVAVENQVCPIAGSQPGEGYVNAELYMEKTYGYQWSNASRNVGILFGFWFFFLIVFMIASEFLTDPAAAGGIMVFKRTRDTEELLKTKDDPILERVDDQQDDVEDGRRLEVSNEVFNWHNINYDIQIKGKPRRLLDNVSGYVAPGKMTALMGESGAGKTTLLNVLAQRVDTGVITGDFLVNGRTLPKSFQADTGYCQQQDVHLAQQTVREALQFSALLRQPRETSPEDRLAYVETVIDMLEMRSFADAIVGEVGEGLNVEQRKRLTIGVELAAKPRLLLFLDEPTSGLDAQAAWSIVRFLKKLANNGQAILCTIHQPSGELFNQFDRLLLLQKGGKTVYFGDIGQNSMTLINYFEQRSGVKCGENDNPAEYILEVIGAGATATTDKDWQKLFAESELARVMQEEIAHFGNITNADESPEAISRSKREYAQPLHVQVLVTTWRMVVTYWRDPIYLASKIGLNILGGCFIGSSFWGQGQKVSRAALQNKLFAVFMALTISNAIAQQLQPVALALRGLYEVRERPSKMFRWPVFVFSVAIIEVPWNLIGGTIFWVAWYFMVGFSHSSTAAVYSWGMYMLFQLFFSSGAQALALIAPNAMIASILFSTFFSFVIVFCGMVQPPSQLPYFWRSWMFPLSPFTHIVEGMMGNALHSEPVRCTPDEFNHIVPPAGQTCQEFLGNFSSTLDQPPVTGAGYFEDGANGVCNFCAMREGEDYLRSIQLSSANRFKDFGYLVAYIAFNYLLAFALYYLFRVHRWKHAKRA